MAQSLLIEASRQLRKKQTPHERKLWNLLRDRRFAGFKFRRQFVISPYIVDFCCFQNKTVIELDGGGHAQEVQRKLDAERDSYLKELGYKVIRVWNHQLDRDREVVLDFLFKMLNFPLTPTLSPEEREEKL